jgi:hypothetical protein
MQSFFHGDLKNKHSSHTLATIHWRDAPVCAFGVGWLERCCAGLTVRSQGQASYLLVVTGWSGLTSGREVQHPTMWSTLNNVVHNTTVFAPATVVYARTAACSAIDTSPLANAKTTEPKLQPAVCSCAH